jgi:hypothetical protein
MKIYPKDIHVTSHNPAPRPFKWLTPEEKIKEEEKKQQKRGKIKKLSFGSVKRLKFLLRNIVHKMEYEAGHFLCFIKTKLDRSEAYY